MIIRVLDPTNEVKAAGGQQAVRPTTLKGKTVGSSQTARKAPKGISPHSNVSSAKFLASLMSFGGPSRISAPLLTHRSSTKSRPGRLSSPVSGIEAVAHRAVCMTLLQLNDKASPP